MSQPQPLNGGDAAGCPAHTPTPLESTDLAHPLQSVQECPGPRNIGRASVIGALREDPYWPTRVSVPTILGAVRGVGRPTPLPPGPKGLPVLGSLLSLRRNPFEYMRRNATQYGDIFRVPLPLMDIVAVTHPDLVSAFMDEPTGRYSMVGPARLATHILGAAVPMLEGEKFRQRRKMLLPMFSRRHLARIGDIIADEFVKRVDLWAGWADRGQVVDLQHEIAKVTLPAFLRAMFSSTITEEEIHNTDIDIRMMMGLIGGGTLMMPMPNLLPWPGRQSAPRSFTRIHLLVRKLIRRRRETPADTRDLLDILLDARYDDGSPLSERDLAMELIVLIGGGYETVVASLSWTLALLLAHPEHLAALYDEIDALGGAVPTPDDLPRLTWAKACFDEGQRLQGHPMNPRFCMADNELGGYILPKYTLVGAPMYAIHRDPRWWPEPDIYDPTRFTDEAAVKARPRLAFMPFGSGPHHCVGTGLAYMNAQFLLAIIFQRYRLRLQPGWTPHHKFTFSVTVDGGLPITLSRV
ncbi:Putative cytochrome P450 [Mycobacteroides abscessus subsp. bolletii]|nr:Putative cytochrome P450 [Mycobacteroides abscessus subsp. bolletii]SKQ45498.1 Putative cytochrome P450 [Mycobacteroides abscessus subsp. bolletii]SKQ47628.1 Putative cytochrome P450 [Mycobacteroides abscessus subsp. bolletii]SKQ50255.1 Putative cytochrome P450 [Mycobacteroides abscessus subsp. bolletii]